MVRIHPWTYKGRIEMQKVNKDLEFAFEALEPEEAEKMRKIFYAASETAKKDIIAFFQSDVVVEDIYNKRKGQLGL